MRSSTIAQWTDECGSELEVIDQGGIVEIVSHSGSYLLLGEDDALKVYEALERWIAKKNSAGLQRIPDAAVDRPIGRSGEVG